LTLLDFKLGRCFGVWTSSGYLLNESGWPNAWPPDGWPPPATTASKAELPLASHAHGNSPHPPGRAPIGQRTPFSMTNRNPLPDGLRMGNQWHSSEILW